MMLAERRAQGEGSVYEGKDGRWHASLRLGRDSAGKPIRRHVRAATRRQAMSKLELLRITYGPLSTVGDWTATWMGLVERTLKWSTAKSYRTHVGYLRPLADLPLSELTVEHIEAVYRYRASTGRGSGVAVGRHRFRTCDALTVRRALQRRTWKHGCQSDRCGQAAWRCPKRHSGGLVADSPKSATAIRTVALPPLLVSALWEHQLTQSVERAAVGDCWEVPPRKDGLNSGTGWVFAAPTGKPIRPGADWAAWKVLLADAGVRDGRLHDARLTAARSS